MELKALRTRQHRRALFAGMGVSLAAHGVLLGGFVFDVPGASEGPAPELERADAVEVYRTIEIVRFATRSPEATQANALYGGAFSAPSPAPASTGSGSASSAAAPPAWAQPLPVSSLLSEPSPMTVAELTPTAPVVFANLEALSPDPVLVGSGSEGDEDEDGGWLSGLAGIFGGIGVSLDGGICPVPQGRTGWR